MRLVGPNPSSIALCSVATVASAFSVSTTNGLASVATTVTLTSPTLVIAAMVAVIIINSMFSAAAGALEILRPLHIKQVKDGQEKLKARLLSLMDRKARLLAACAVGNHFAQICLIFLSFLLAPGIAEMITPGMETPSFGNLMVAAMIAALPVVAVNLVFGELVPKSFGGIFPHRTAFALDRFVSAAAILLSLFAYPIAALANLITSRFGGRAGFASENPAEEEIKNLVESAQETGEIEKDEKELLHSVFEFTDTVAREVMTPRVDLDALPISSEPSRVVALIQETGHSRIPLYEDTDDQIVGIIHAKDVLSAMVTGNAVHLRSLMRTPLFVPETKNLHELLQEMRNSKSQMAIVQDEFGGTAGVVTIEDIVEELVGDIVDEYDNEEPAVVPSGKGWLIDGKTHREDVNHEIGSQFESDQFDTIGGYVFGLFGRQPSEGEAIDDFGYRFTVAQTDGRRIHRLLVEPLEQEGDLFSDEEAAVL